jgi:hypothetical protein
MTMHHAIPIFATGALALVAGVALAGGGASDHAPVEIPTVSDPPVAAAPDPQPPSDPCRAMVAHVDDLVAQAVEPRVATAPDDRADPCASATVPPALARCYLAATGPGELADCHLDALDAPAREVHVALAQRLAGDGERLDPERLATTTAAMVAELGGDGERAAAMVREALAGMEDDDASP